MQQYGGALGLAQEMGAGDDLLAGVAALAYRVPVEPVQPKLLRGPAFALIGRQARQALAQIRLAPWCTAIGGCRITADAQNARQPGAAPIQFDAAIGSDRGSVAAGQRRGGKAAAGLAVIDLEGELAAEDKALQRLAELGSVAVGEDRQQVAFADPQQCQHRQHPSLGIEPAAPLPLPGRQQGHVIGQL